jgi:aldehyde dehydrogenase (NAD+)
VYQAAAKYLTPVTLELGGKSPAILLEDCQLEMSVKRLIWAKFLNAGQTCVAPDYVLVPENLEKSFLELVKKEIDKQQFSIENKNYTQIINNKNGKRLSDLLQPEKVFVGGNYNETTRIFEPTILQNISFEDPIMQEEIFGPILPVIRYNTINEAIEKVKRLEKPLACYVFTSSKSSKDKILNEFSFGSGCVNDAMMQISNTHLPFGGVGQSGIGSYHGENGFKAFSHYKSILQKPTWFELKLKYFPHTILKMRCIKLIIGVK